MFLCIATSLVIEQIFPKCLLCAASYRCSSEEGGQGPSPPGAYLLMGRVDSEQAGRHMIPAGCDR